MQKGNTLLKNTAVLALSSMVIKGLSAAYRIPLTRMLGESGMGRYSAAFNIFMPFFALATAGITPTVSRLCAAVPDGDNSMIVRIKKKAGALFGLTGTVLAVLALAVSIAYARYIDSPVMRLGVALMCPNLIFAVQEAVYKGVSQGTFNMAVSARAGILESSLKLVIGISRVYLAGIKLRKWCPEAQLRCAWATVSVCGLACLLYMRNDFRHRYSAVFPSVRNGSGNVVRAQTLFSMAGPIAASALLVSMSGFFDTVVCLSIIKGIPDSVLQAAYPFAAFSAQEEKAMWLYGIYQGMCLSVANLIPSLSAAIGSAGLPSVTKSLMSSDRSAAAAQTDSLIKLTAASVVPVSLFVWFFGEEVLTVLYGDRGSRTLIATLFLRTMAPVAILSAFSYPLNSVLHACGKSRSIFRILLICCTVKTVLGAALCSIGSINIRGCVYSGAVFHVMVFVMTVYEIKKTGGFSGVIPKLIMPCVLSYTLLTFIKALSDFVLYNVPVVFRTVFCGGLFVASYLRLLFFMGFFVDNSVAG